MRYVHKGCSQVRLTANIVHEWNNVSEISRISIFQSWQLCLRKYLILHNMVLIVVKDAVVEVPSMNAFKSRVDKLWERNEIMYDPDIDLHAITSARQTRYITIDV